MDQWNACSGLMLSFEEGMSPTLRGVPPLHSPCHHSCPSERAQKHSFLQQNCRLHRLRSEFTGTSITASQHFPLLPLLSLCFPPEVTQAPLTWMRSMRNLIPAHPTHQAPPVPSIREEREEENDKEFCVHHQLIFMCTSPPVTLWMI